MNMVNTHGLTLFGSGSEWFWSMLQFVVVAVTLIAIYVQLRQDRAANAFAQASSLRQDWHDEIMTRRKLAHLLALRDDAPDADVLVLAEPIGNFWEHVGGLVRAGHVSLPLVYEYLGSPCQTTWNIVEPQMRLRINLELEARQSRGTSDHFRDLASAHGRYLVLATARLEVEQPRQCLVQGRIGIAARDRDNERLAGPAQATQRGLQ